MLRIRLAEVAKQSAQHRRGRRHGQRLPGEISVQVDAGQDPGPQRLGIPLDPGELAGEEDRLPFPGSEPRPQARRTVDVGVPVDAAVAEKLRSRQAGYRPEHPLLFGNPEPGLEAHQVPHLAGLVLSPQLHHCPRFLPGAWIGQAHRLHRAEAQRLGAAAGHFLDRQTALEVGHLVELVAVKLVGGRECGNERGVVLPGHRGVQIVVAVALLVAGELVKHRVVQ